MSMAKNIQSQSDGLYDGGRKYLGEFKQYSVVMETTSAGIREVNGDADVCSYISSFGDNVK